MAERPGDVANRGCLGTAGGGTALPNTVVENGAGLDSRGCKQPFYSGLKVGDSSHYQVFVASESATMVQLLGVVESRQNLFPMSSWNLLVTMTTIRGVMACQNPQL